MTVKFSCERKRFPSCSTYCREGILSHIVIFTLFAHLLAALKLFCPTLSLSSFFVLKQRHKQEIFVISFALTIYFHSYQ